MLDYILSVIQEAAIKYDVSAWALRKTLSCESMNFDWNVIIGVIPGTQRELGIAQLHPQGLLPLFYKLGYESPLSIANSVFFMARMFAAGQAGHWTCYHTAVLGQRFPWW